MSAVGYNALHPNTTGQYKTAVGANALEACTTGSNNVAVGKNALLVQTTSDSTVAVGAFAGDAITTTNHTTLVGYAAGGALTTGNGHTLIGSGAGGGLTTSEGNVCVGQLAGNYNVAVTGSSNIIIGLNARGSAGANDYELVFGRDADGKGSNTGLMKASSGMYQSNNSSSWSTTSDERIKKNIVDYNEGLSKILNVRVRNFEYRTEEEITAFENPRSAKVDKQGIQLGVIAQELEQVIPRAVSETSDGVKVVNDDDLIWHLVNAVKELSAKVETLESKLNN